LAYDSVEGVLQVVCYRKMVVTNASLGSLASVGVAQHLSDGVTSTVEVVLDGMAPGMEFMDNKYVMQTYQLFTNKIYAKRVYKIVDHGSERSSAVKEL
jgi:hypothetical protein